MLGSFGKEWSVVIGRDRVVDNTARDRSVGVIIMVSFYLCLHPFLQFPSLHGCTLLKNAFLVTFLFPFCRGKVD